MKRPSLGWSYVKWSNYVGMNEKLAYQLREVELYETILVLEAEFPLL